MPQALSSTTPRRRRARCWYSAGSSIDEVVAGWFANRRASRDRQSGEDPDAEPVVVVVIVGTEGDLNRWIKSGEVVLKEIDDWPNKSEYIFTKGSGARKQAEAGMMEVLP